MKKDFKKIKRNSGAAMLMSVIFFLFISLAIISGLVSPTVREFKNASINLNSKKSYFLSESGGEDALYRILKNISVGESETIILDSNSATTAIGVLLGNKEINSLGDVGSLQRKTNITLAIGTGASFNYGIQTGPGGFVLENSASVTGNVYSSGSILGSGNTIYGDAISAGPTGLINNIHTISSAYAHTIQDSDVDANAYYSVKTNTTVNGTSYPNSADQPVASLPITDDQIDELEADALAGGVINSPCPYIINSSRTIGPVKINCNLEISGSPTVILNGSIWVTGNVSIRNSAVIRVYTGLGSKSVAIIADNPNNRITSSSIDLANSSQFFGSGSAGSFVFLISQNNSAESGGSDDAISMDNSSSGSVILYASHGLININNSATLKEVTGYKIKARNSANIVYDTGLANTLFTSGPGGGYEIIGWKEK